jgi:DNA replication and repair protein RecF
MHVRHLSVVDFRSWPSAELSLVPGPVALVGPNGQGKTNLLEAVHYLSTLGSHRASSDAALVRAGAERAVIRAAAVAQGAGASSSGTARELRVEVEIVPGRTNRAKLGNAALPRPRDILGALRTVLFAPEDLAVVAGDPAERRRYLDELAISRRPRLAAARADYERVLKQRATLLKTAGLARHGPGEAQLGALDAWDAQLAGYGAEVLHARLVTLADLGPHVTTAWTQLAPGAAPIAAGYQTSLAALVPAVGDPELVPTADVLRDALAEQITRMRTAELERGVNLVGPHRDDIELRIGPLPARSHASHGESWTIALALRLASYELLRADELPGGSPILLLDDVFAHLDDERREQLALAAGKAEQAIVTAASASDVPGNLHGLRLRVAAGQVVADD